MPFPMECQYRTLPRSVSPVSCIYSSIRSMSLSAWPHCSGVSPGGEVGMIVTLSGIEYEGTAQLSLLREPDERGKQLMGVLDKVNAK
ncbi:MAG: hypothetical protein FD177_2430 [Desulfovibrionaceae bacterium]|nr:MAG: hypothetical protein FD177_2430 [Desulfovibrionaceae bacterium]